MTTATPFLPPLLTTENGTSVSSAAAWWAARRPEVSSLLQQHLVGTLPATRPALLSSSVLNRTRDPRSGALSAYVRLSFAVAAMGDGTIDYELEILAPNSSAHSPLFLTQWNHRQWALLGVSRGYVSVVYPGADTRDAAPAFQRAYRAEASMALIVARAFVASTVLDYVLSPRLVADLGPAVAPLAPGQVAISGHSRNGKQSLLAAAFDARISAVVGSSPGAPISSPYHFSSHNFYGEGPDAGVAGSWWLPSITQYTEHPETLPMDGHGVLALVAPRACAVADGWTDREGDLTFADEAAVRAARAVYVLLGAPANLTLIHRPGDHHGFASVNSYFDFFDARFGRLDRRFALGYAGQALSTSDLFPLAYLTAAGFEWRAWRDAFGARTPAPPPRAAPLAARVAWVLQRGEPTVRAVPSTYSEEGLLPSSFAYASVLLSHDLEDTDARVARQPISFGDYVTANVFFPAAAAPAAPAALPAVVWLHPYSYATGYTPAYGMSNVVDELVRAGYAVLAYDQAGFASRLREGGTAFYARHGGAASLFGHMVRDALAAVDALLCLTPRARANATRCGTGEAHGGAYPSQLGRVPPVDGARIFVAGFSLGANVALHAAAASPAVAGVASVAGFTPYHTEVEGRATGGLRRLFELHALLPRLGLFAARPAEVPYDYDELLAALAPRPTLLHTPTQDRDASHADVSACIARAAGAWGAQRANLNHTSAETGTRMGHAETRLLIEWLSHARARLSVVDSE